MEGYYSLSIFGLFYSMALARKLAKRKDYAGQRWGLRCRCDFSNLSAVRFVYRYV